MKARLLLGLAVVFVSGIFAGKLLQGDQSIPPYLYRQNHPSAHCTGLASADFQSGGPAQDSAGHL